MVVAKNISDQFGTNSPVHFGNGDLLAAVSTTKTKRQDARFHSFLPSLGVVFFLLPVISRLLTLLVPG